MEGSGSGTQRISDRTAKGTFAARLRSMRELAGLTQEELASRAELSLNAVSALERGQRKRPYPHTVRALADALDLNDADRSLLLASVPKRENAKPPESPVQISARDLPRPLTSLLGRDDELLEVSEMIVHPDTRLVTLTGPGGTGKTRLALEVARDTTRRFSGGTYFVALAPLSEKDFLLDEVARSLGVPATEGASITEALVTRLRRSDALIVLDNFEHLLEAAPQLADLLTSCPNMTVLVTSRSPLRVRGERTYPVPPLGLPPAKSASAEDVANSPSAMLFVERARSASPEFQVTSENVLQVAAICRRLAGIPLALELAAGKIGFLEPSALLSRLDLLLSTPGARDLPERQRTMQATLDWSYDLLSESERVLLASLSTFSGGFTLEAAEAVGGRDSLGDLESLVELSLVQHPRNVSGEARFELHEPIRQYAHLKLEESGRSNEARDRLAHYFKELLTGSEKQVLTRPDWWDRLETEKDNLQNAFSRLLEDDGDVAAAVRMLWTLQSFVWVREYHREGRRWAEEILRRDLSESLRARAMYLAALTAFRQGDSEIASANWTEMREIAHREGETLLEAYAEGGLGLVSLHDGEYETAVLFIEKSLALFESCDELDLIANARTLLGNTLLAMGEIDRAAKTFESGLNFGYAADHDFVVLNMLHGLVNCEMVRGDHAKARGLCEIAMHISKRVGDRLKLAQLLEVYASTATPERDAKWIATILGATEALRADSGTPGHESLSLSPGPLEDTRSRATDKLGTKTFETQNKLGREMDFDEVVEYALQYDATPSDSSA